jgi:hypothetical protein
MIRRRAKDHIVTHGPGVTAPINEILKLDGRYRAPMVDIFRYNPSPPSVKAVRDAIKHFIKEGQSGRHSPYAILLRYIVAYCEANNVSYQLTCGTYEGRKCGYFIKRMDDVQRNDLERP